MCPNYTHSSSSRVFVVVVEVNAKEEVLQMRLVAPVHQLGHHCGNKDLFVNSGFSPAN